MCGQDFYGYEDSLKAAKQAARRQRLEENPIPVVIEVRGYPSTIRRELERRVAKESAVAGALGLKRIGSTWLPVKWPVQRPVFQAPPGMFRKDHQVKLVGGQMFLLRRWTGELSLAS